MVEAVKDAEDKPPDGDAGRRVSPGVAMQAQLFKSAEAFTKMRGAASVVGDGEEMKRIAAKFAEALLGSRAPLAGAGVGTLDEDDLLALKGISSTSGSFFP